MQSEQILLLPGQHEDNYLWAKNLAEHLPFTPNIARYPWWDGESTLSPHQIAERVAPTTPDFLIAKSIGSYIASLASALKPVQKVVLIGIPFEVLGEDELTSLKRFIAQRKVLIIQQQEDKVGSVANIRTWLADTPHELLAIPGRDHRYEDFALVASAIQNWAQPNPVAM